MAMQGSVRLALKPLATVFEVPLVLQYVKPARSRVVAQQLAALNIEIPAVQRERALPDAPAYPGKRHQVIQGVEYRLLLAGAMARGAIGICIFPVYPFTCGIGNPHPL